MFILAKYKERPLAVNATIIANGIIHAKVLSWSIKIFFTAGSSNQAIEEVVPAIHIDKIKHKISILGLEKSYKIAEQHENNLREGNVTLQDKFSDILNNVTNYLNKL